jgi:hypothetical protein
MFLIESFLPNEKRKPAEGTISTYFFGRPDIPGIVIQLKPGIQLEVIADKKSIA